MADFINRNLPLEKVVQVTKKLTKTNDSNLPEKEVSSLEKVVQVVKELTQKKESNKNYRVEECFKVNFYGLKDDKEEFQFTRDVVFVKDSEENTYGFFKSTGTSNNFSEDFKDTWFPFFGIKITESESKNEINYWMVKGLDHRLNDIKYILPRDDELINEILLNCEFVTNILCKNFFNYFPSFETLQISALLNGGFWENKKTKILKHSILNYDINYKKLEYTFEPLVLKDFKDINIKFPSDSNVEFEELINKKLITNDKTDYNQGQNYIEINKAFIERYFKKKIILDKKKFQDDMSKKELDDLKIIYNGLTFDIDYYKKYFIPENINKSDPKNIDNFYRVNKEKNHDYLINQMPESLPNDESRNNLLKNINKINIEKLEIVNEILKKINTERKTILIIVKCNKEDKFGNNTEIKNEINSLRNSGKFEPIFEYYYESDLFKLNFTYFIKTFKEKNCDITFCGLYGNTCVIKTLILIANNLNNENNNYYFSFMGTRFLPMDLFNTYSPSPCNIYPSLTKNIFSKIIIKKVSVSLVEPYGDFFEYNIENHKYWIFKSIEGMKLESHIKIIILDYKGQQITKPNKKKKKLEFILSPDDTIYKKTFDDAKKNTKKVSDEIQKIIKKRNQVIDKRKSKRFFGGGKNRKTRKIKAKKTRKFRVKKPRKRSLR